MKSKLRIPAGCLLALACVFAAVPAFADTVVYDNTGPGSYTTNGWSIFGANTVTDSFTLSGTETLDGANFYVWLFPDDSLTSVTWSITDTPFGTPIETGTAAGGPNTQVAIADGYYSVDEDSISIPDITLAAGTYWLELSDGLDAYDTGVWWDESDGPSTALYEDSSDQIPSETFQVIAATPEPSSFVLLSLGMLTLAGLATRSKLLA